MENILHEGGKPMGKSVSQMNPDYSYPLRVRELIATKSTVEDELALLRKLDLSDEELENIYHRSFEKFISKYVKK